MPFEAEHVVAMVRALYADRVNFHDGRRGDRAGRDGAPRRRPFRRAAGGAGGDARRPVVLASDGSHYYANMEQARPFPIVADVTRMVDGWRRLRELASAPRFVVPGHDPEVMRRYAPSAPALADIAVRLDAEPAAA